MQNALQEPQTIVLFGGTSEIGRAMVHSLLAPATRTVVLACRRPSEADTGEFAGEGRIVVAVEFDAARPGAHLTLVESLAATYGDLDVAIVAFAQLGEQAALDADPAAAADLINVNFAGAASISLAVAGQMRRQGHGHIAILSSVAGDRTRPANYVYGASKAGLDAFGQGLADALAPAGVKVTVIRPGFVHSKMTKGRKASAFASVPSQVGEQAVAAMKAGKHTAYTPPILRIVFTILRHVPRFVWRRLPLD